MMVAIPATERVDPFVDEHRVLFSEHIVRYTFASSFVHRKRALDLGCGEGYGVAHVARANAAIVMGIDSDTATVACATKRYGQSGAQFIASDASHLPFPSHSFDIVTCFEVVEHLTQAHQRAMLSEARRVLTPTGVLIISTPNAEIYTPRVSLSLLELNPFHLHELTAEEFRGTLASFFPHVTVIGQSPVPTLLIPNGQRSDGYRYHAIGDTVYGVGLVDRRVAPVGELPSALSPERSLYMLAICGNEGWEARQTGPGVAVAASEMDLLIFALWARWAAHQEVDARRARDHIRHLEDEIERARAIIVELNNDLDKRATWVHSVESETAEIRAAWGSMEQELAERDEQIARLRAVIDLPPNLGLR